MSSIAVPVVSEPVPAVVGIAIRGDKVLVIGKPFPTGALIKSMRSESLYAENLGKRLSNVDTQRETGLRLTGSQLWQCQ